jgi:hypothetical protein
MDDPALFDDAGVVHGRTGPSEVHGCMPFRMEALGKGNQCSGKKDRKRIINLLNYHNFTSEPVFALARDTVTGEELLIGIHPGPCRGDTLTCTLGALDGGLLDAVDVEGILVEDGISIIAVDVEVLERSRNAFTARLKRRARSFTNRRAVRHKCDTVEAVVSMDAGTVLGSLAEFHPGGLRVESGGDGGDLLKKLGTGDVATLSLHSGGEKVYSGTVRVVRVESSGGSVVFAPLDTQVSRYRERRYRNVRVRPVPAPRISFLHPLTLRRVFYDIVDIATSGFSIVERPGSSVLMPGMIIKDAQILFPGELSLSCKAQVIHRRKTFGKAMRFGCAITDMDPPTYTRLFNLITRADDPHSVVSTRISMEALWEFFFKSGFIYPDKYLCISRYKDEFMKTYEHLYHNCPEIFSSLTYQENDRIFGHVSILKVYPSTWMVHHLAAVPMGRRRTGLFVLHQILNYLDGFHRMPQVNMKYLVFYYRPDNKFPNFFFGGVRRILDAPHMCSVDEFAYLTQPLKGLKRELPGGWDLSSCSEEDIAALHEAYHKHSPGLMIEAFGLENADGSIWETYERLGLKRQCTSYVLTRSGRRLAWFIVDRSDRGLNLSDLVNGIKVITADADPASLPWEAVLEAVSILVGECPSEEVVLQVFPCSYLDAAGVSYPKRYCMWIAKTVYFDPHFDAIKKMTKFKYVKFVKSIVETTLGLR